MNSRFRKWIAISIAILTMSSVLFATYLSLDPENYFFYTDEDRLVWTWDPLYVAIVCGIMILGAAIASAAFFLARPSRLWLRCVLALIIIGPWTWTSTLAVMHMPMFVMIHHLWFWLLTIVVIIVGFSSFLSSVLGRIKAKRQGAV